MKKIGVTACFFYPDLNRLVFGAKTLTYLEKDMSLYLSRPGVMPILIPDLPEAELKAFIGELGGVVLQGGVIMAGDIYRNIIGTLPLTLDDAWEAARMAGLDSDIRDMPMGMHTVLNQGAGTLSGGQRQRLLIARAIVHKPRIIYFDEATSALDNATQAVVSQSLDTLKATRIVIAHRLSTIINADRIFVLDRGQLVQQGSYETLIKEKGLFADLAKRQMME